MYMGSNPEPPFEPDELWFKAQVYRHRGVGPNQEDCICLARTWGEPCPICEALNQINDDDLSKKLGSHKPPLCFYNVVDWKTRDQNVEILALSAFLFEKDLSKMLDAKGVKNLLGQPYTIEARVDPEKWENNEYFKITVTNIYPGDDFPDYVWEDAYPLDEMIRKPTEDQLRMVLEGTREISSGGPRRSPENSGGRRRPRTEARAPEGGGRERERSSDGGSRRERPAERTRTGREDNRGGSRGRDRGPEARGRERGRPEPESGSENRGGRERGRASENSRERERRRPETQKENRCPYGHEFGADTDKFRDCRECAQDIFDDCLRRLDDEIPF
jgi:hypothetical protein